ncbi:MAG: hypothetical protein QCI00_10100 [Candidatus Thermoplasmatota archaeon]|nr:hypothetical protein [Candidatus Thermoplasmatota archaeon]
MKERKELGSNASKIKIALGSISLLTVFLTPYLNITQISFNANLFQSAVYSLILLCFWIIAAHVLRSKQPLEEPRPLTKMHDHRHVQHRPVATL